MISRKPEQLFDSDPPSGPRAAGARGAYDDKLNHILAAATAVIARAGYEKASMRAVAKAAGVSLAGLYHYFDSKERMLFLIQLRTFNSLLMNLREKLHGVEDPVQRLRIMIRSHISYFASNLEALRVCSHELDSLSGSAYDETRNIRRDYYDLTRSIVDGVFAELAPDSILDPHVSTMVLFGMLNWLYRWYDPRKGHTPATLANQISEQFLHGVAGAGRRTAYSPPVH